MLGLLTEITLKSSIWTIGKVYDLGYWIIYGTPKTKTEKLIEKQNNYIECLSQELKELKEFIHHVNLEIDVKEVMIEDID